MAIKLQGLETDLKLNASGLTSGINLAIAGIATVVAGIGIAAKATFDWAADLDALGDVMDGTTDQMAALAFTARKSGVGVDAVAKANVIFQKGLLKTNGTLDTIGLSLKKYGIAVKDANGKVKDSVQLTDEISKKYAELGTNQEKLNFLTEIYGKNGAAMVDFFDTLVKDGGIDAVTKKVKDLGLAIDPGRYEQFNRNLEELKLIGTGLAVQLTEKLMPVLESITDWVMNEGIPNFLAFKKRLEDAFKTGGWSAVFSTLDDELSKALDNVDWEGLGNKLGELIDKAVGTSIGGIDWPKWTVSLGNGLKELFIAAIGGPEIWDVWKRFFSEEGLAVVKVWSQQLQDQVSIALSNMLAWIGSKLSAARDAFVRWATQDVPASMNAWKNNLLTIVANTMNDLYVNTSNKLRDIAKEFFNRAVAWGQQMISGLNSGKGRLLSFIGGLVDDINSELKKIITSFTITVKTLFGGGTSTPTTTGGTTGGMVKPPKNKRASGGPVWAGTAYNVNELGKQEVFIPAQNGRIESKPSQATVARIDKRDMEMLADLIVEKALRVA